MTTRVLTFLGFWLVPWLTGHAQVPNAPVAEGQRIRITMPSHNPHRVFGTFEQLVLDSLTLRAAEERITVPLAAMTRLELSRGYKSAVGKGVRTGLIAGLLAGAAVGIIACVTYDIAQGTCLDSKEGAQLLLWVPIATGVVAGAGIGAIIGATGRTERWESIPVPGRSPAATESNGALLGAMVRW